MYYHHPKQAMQDRPGDSKDFSSSADFAFLIKAGDDESLEVLLRLLRFSGTGGKDPALLFFLAAETINQDHNSLIKMRRPLN